MAKKIKEHLIRRKFHYLLPMFVVAISAGLYLSFLGGSNAAAVTGVTLSDNDTAGYGLDGRDFTVSWTPGVEPSGYDSTYIYIVSSTAILSTSTLNTACNGSPCIPRGMFTFHDEAMWTLPQMFTTDSAGEAMTSTRSYVAWVYVSSTVPIIASSSAVSYANSFDTPVDTNAPQVDHMSVHTAETGNDATMYAIVVDDQTSSSSFANTLDGGNEYIWIYYGSDVSANAVTSSAALVSGDLFSFIVPSAVVGANGNTFEYFIAANDAANNTKYICNDFNASSAADCAANPFVVNTSYTRGIDGINLSGFISSDGLGLESAIVFLSGFATTSVSTNMLGAYSFSYLPTSTAYDIIAYKAGYCQQTRFESVTTTNRALINMNLNFGACGFAQGEDGAPNVIFSGPPNGAQYVPVGENIRIGLSQPMDANTINDADPTNLGSNIYLTPDDGTTKIAGTVTYCADSNSQGCSNIPSGDRNVILFNPTNDLSTETFYTLVITSAVKSTGGRSIAGNRSGGGHQISFTTAGAAWDPGSEGANYGTGGQYMPPYVRSMVPAPGIYAALNTDIILEFNEVMNSATINTTNFVVYNETAGSNVSLNSVSLDSNENRFVTIDPGVLTSGNRYQVRVRGAVANARGMTIGDPNNGSAYVFTADFEVSGSSDSAAPSIYPSLANNTTGVSVNRIFEFGFSEQLSVSTINTSNIVLRRGSSVVSATVDYDPGANSVYVIPDDALAPNTVYTITFGTNVTDLAGNSISQTTYTYTTGAADTVEPEILEARCDDYTCTVFFTENMNHDSRAGDNWETSVINPSNWILQRTAPTSGGIDVSGRPISYDEREMSATVEGFSGLSAGNNFTVTINAVVTDLSGNPINSLNSSFSGTVEDSRSTYGDFGGGGMFGPPIAGGAGAGEEFHPEGFGSFTGEQFIFGQADMAFPFNQMAGQDSNVFQVRFVPGQALQDNDIIVLTFPNGTTIDNAVPDTFSPFYSDFNDFGSGTVAFNSNYMGDGVGVSSTAREVRIMVDVTGTLDADDPIMIDLRKIVNPLIPKGPETGGYTLGIKVERGGTVIINKTSMPYFINEAGTNKLIVRIFAGTATTSPVAGADGSVFLFGGGPNGPMDKSVTLTDGQISAVDGTASTSIGFFGIPDGCYFFGTDPFVTLGGKDYFGAFSPEPICVDSNNPSVTKDILLSPAGGTASVTTTVEIMGIDFAGADVDVFAGGPGRFVVKTLSNMGDYSSTATSTELQLPANGTWFVGVGPAMPKGKSMAAPTPLPGVPPAPMEIIVAGVGTNSPTVSPGYGSTPIGTSFNDPTDTITFTFTTADKTITGTLTDGTSPLANVEVFVHQNGFGAPMFDTTDSNGEFSINVAQYGSYEIGAFKDGLPPVFKQIEVREDGSDAGTEPDIYYQGKQVVPVTNPLVLTLKKPDYYISGKVLDANGNGISYAPVFAHNNSTGDFVSGGTGFDGSYTIFVDNGTWIVKSELPPDKSDTCGTFSKTVVVAGGNQTNQNLSPSISTCYTLSGAVSVGGASLANVPVFVEEWDSANNHPLPSGFMKGASTDSNGAYSVKVGNGTYRIGVWHPDYGELSTIVTVNGSNVTNANVTVANTANITFVFTGGTSSMSAFVEVKNSSDKTKRFGKQHNGLDSNLTMSVEDGAAYNYFVDVFGYGDFSGSVAAGGTAVIDVSASSFITVTGTVKDASDNILAGALVMFSNTDTDVVQTAITDSNGNYSVGVKADTYEVTASLAGYIPGEAAQSFEFTADTTGHSFGIGEEHAPLTASNRTIEGVISDSDGNPMSEGYVWATNADGIVVKAVIDPDDGSYSLPVIDGTWTVKAAGPLHNETALSGSVVVDGSDSINNNFRLEANSDRVPASTSGVVAANTGGSVNDMDASGIKLTVGSGVLETGSGNVTINMERSYSAPDSENFDALSNATFKITASGNSTIKDLNGNAEIQIDYTDLLADMPAGLNESDLQLMYYSSERGEYVPVEGGFTIDTENNTISGLVDHFTDFVITYNPPLATASVSSGAIGGAATGPNPPSLLIPRATEFEPVEKTEISNTYELNTSTEITVGASVYKLSVFDADEDSVSINIGEEPLAVIVKKGKAKIVDTDMNGYANLKIKYNGLNNGLPKLTFINLVDDGELRNAFTINYGMYETDSRMVELVFNVTNTIQVAVSNNEDFSGISFMDYVPTMDWELTEGNGTKTVYVKFRSNRGGILETSDTIKLIGQPYNAYDPDNPSEGCPLSIGGVYKTVDSPGVYKITDECTKRPFRNSLVYFTYFDSWKSVVTVSAKLLDLVPDDQITFMPWGPGYNLGEGSLAKVITDSKVYVLLGGNKHWIATEGIFNALGYAWEWIEDVVQELLDKYDDGADVESVLPNYSLIKHPGSSDIYRIEPDPDNPSKQIKRHITTQEALERFDYREDRIVAIPDLGVYPEGDPIE